MITRADLLKAQHEYEQTIAKLLAKRNALLRAYADDLAKQAIERKQQDMYVS